MSTPMNASRSSRQEINRQVDAPLDVIILMLNKSTEYNKPSESPVLKDTITKSHRN